MIDRRSLVGRFRSAVSCDFQVLLMLAATRASQRKSVCRPHISASRPMALQYRCMNGVTGIIEVSVEAKLLWATYRSLLVKPDRIVVHTRLLRSSGLSSIYRSEAMPDEIIPVLQRSMASVAGV